MPVARNIALSAAPSQDHDQLPNALARAHQRDERRALVVVLLPAFVGAVRFAVLFVVFVAVDFRAAVFLVADFFVAVADFFVAADFVAVDFFVAADFFAAVADFFVVVADVVAVDFFAAPR